MREERGEKGKEKAKLRQHEQRTSNEVRMQFVPFGARTANVGKAERRKQSFVSMSSVRQTKYGRSSYRLVREQRMLAKQKTKK